MRTIRERGECIKQSGRRGLTLWECRGIIIRGGRLRGSEPSGPVRYEVPTLRDRHGQVKILKNHLRHVARLDVEASADRNAQIGWPAARRSSVASRLDARRVGRCQRRRDLGVVYVLDVLPCLLGVLPFDSQPGNPRCCRCNAGHRARRKHDVDIRASSRSNTDRHGVESDCCHPCRALCQQCRIHATLAITSPANTMAAVSAASTSAAAVAITALSAAAAPTQHQPDP